MRIDKKEDKFQETITKIVKLYYRNRREFLIGLGALGILIIVLIISLSGRGKEHPEVQLRFTEALGIYSTAQTPEQFSAAEERFIEFTRRFGKHYLVGKAYFYLGNISYNQGDYEKARNYFTKAYRKLKNDPILGPASLMGIANCWEELGKLTKAAEIYLQVYEKYKKSQLAPEAILAAGRCYKLEGNYQLAEKNYARALKELPPGEAAETARAELSYIKALKNKFHL
jgi:TolA-binding protein